MNKQKITTRFREHAAFFDHLTDEEIEQAAYRSYAAIVRNFGITAQDAADLMREIGKQMAAGIVRGIDEPRR